MARKYVRGDKAVGICQRCSKKLLRKHMVEDGYYPSLMVCPECADQRHPQERLPKLDDPVTVYKPAPDDVGTPPELFGEIEGTTATLTWDEAIPINARIDSYDLYRRVLGTTDWTLVISLPITYGIFMDIEAQTLEYDDTGLTPDVTYEYFVDATTDPEGPDPLSSNIVQVTAEEDVGFGTALLSESINGSDYAAPSEWAFGSSDFTCQFWFRDTGVVDNEQFRVLRARPSSGNQSGWEAQVRTSTMRLLLRPVSTSFTFNSPTLVEDLTEWNNFAFVVDRANNLCTYYVNGASIGTSDISAVVGNVGFSGSMSIMQNIAGEVDELRVWTVALSGAQIAANYLVPFSDPGSEANILADWQFNEGSGSTTTESVLGTIATIVSGGTFVAGPP